MTGSWRCRWVFLAPTCLASCSCRRPLCLFLSLLFSPHPTLHEIPSPPLSHTISMILLICLPLSANNICCFFSYSFHQHHHHFSLSASSISFSTLCCFSSSLVVSLQLPNTSKTNPPHCTCSPPSVINSCGLRPFMYVSVCGT